MFKVTGLNEMTKRLDELAKKAEELDGEHSVAMAELLTPPFLSRHTRFVNVEEMFESSGFKIETEEDLEAIPDDKWDEFIRSVSGFANWESMISEATKEWVAKRMGF